MEDERGMGLRRVKDEIVGVEVTVGGTERHEVEGDRVFSVSLTLGMDGSGRD